MKTYKEFLNESSNDSKIKAAAKFAFNSSEGKGAKFVLVVDMGDDFSVVDYDTEFDNLIPTVADITEGPVWIVDKKMKITKFEK